MKPFLSALGLDRLTQNEQKDNVDESTHTQLSLNPNAVPFTPNSSNDMSPLSPIAENNEYNNEDDWICDNLYLSNDNILKLRYIIYISNDITQTAVRKNALKEYFNTEQDLFYHLRWQVRMQVIDKKYKIFKSNINDDELIIFHSDLHHSNNNNSLYIIGVQNDINKSHSVKWKMIQFMTANDIYFTYGISANNLPISSRNNLYTNTGLQKINYMKDIKNYEINIHKLIKIEQIKKKPSVQPLTVTYSELNKSLMDSILLYELIPIIWFDKKLHNANYKTQMLLPIKLRGNNWIGIVFDYNNNGQLIPVTICVDHIDIQRKLALYKPLNNGEEYKWFTNNISEIKATNDEIETLIWFKDERIKELEKIIKQKDEEIKRLKSIQGNENLKD